MRCTHQALADLRDGRFTSPDSSEIFDLAVANSFTYGRSSRYGGRSSPLTALAISDNLRQSLTISDNLRPQPRHRIAVPSHTLPCQALAIFRDLKDGMTEAEQEEELVLEEGQLTTQLSFYLPKHWFRAAETKRAPYQYIDQYRSI